MTDHSRTIQDIFEGRMRFVPMVHRQLKHFDASKKNRQVPEIVVKSIAMASSGGMQFFCGSCGDYSKSAEIFATEFNCTPNTVKKAFMVEDCETRKRIIRFRLESRFLMTAKQRHRDHKIDIETALQICARVGVWDIPVAFEFNSVENVAKNYADELTKSELSQADLAIGWIDRAWVASSENLLKCATEWLAMTHHPDPGATSMNVVKHFNRLKASGHTLEV